MYETFFGFTGKPFSLLPDAEFLYHSRRHKRAITLLDYGLLTGAGFLVLTGEVGAGKTTVMRRFLKSAGPEVALGVITNPSASAGRLLDWIAACFDLSCPERDNASLYHAFVAFLLETYAQNRRTVLVIDEAQNLGPEQLEELRMLSNVNNEKDQVLQIVLLGQPELLAMLNKPELRQFAQRIAVHSHLDPLTPAETAGYIRHRLSVVGGDGAALFDDLSCAMVHYFTGGVPRLINLLCDQALVYAFAEDKRSVSAETLCDVAADRAASGLSAFRALPAGVRESKDMAATLPEIAAILAEIKRGLV